MKLISGEYLTIVKGVEHVNRLTIIGHRAYWSKGQPDKILRPLNQKYRNWWKIAFIVLLILNLLPLPFYDGMDELGCLYFNVFGKLFIFGVLQ